MHERFDGDEVELATLAAGVHVLFEVLVHVLKDEHKLVFCMDDVVEGNDVFVLQLLHEGNFADGGARSAFFTVEVDFF